MLETMLLWLDALLNLLLGVALLWLPQGLLRWLGLPVPQVTLYPRIFGGVLVGIAAALALEATAPAFGGLGLGGAVAINLCGAATVAGCLLHGVPGLALRGRALLWMIVALLIGLSAFELLVV